MDVPRELVRAFDRPLPELPEEGNPILRMSREMSSFRDDDYIRVEVSSGSGRRTGRTALGIRLRYVVMAYSSISLVMRHTGLSKYHQSFLLKMKSDVARLRKGRVAIALNGRLRFPFVWQENTSEAASLTDPEEAHYFKFYLFFEPDSLVVYDWQTGDILGSADFPLTRVSTKNYGSEIVISPRER